MRLVQNGNTLMLARRAAYVATATDMQGIAGRYYSPELDTAYELVADGTTLVVRRRHNADMKLRVAGRDSFGGSWPIGTLRVERDAGGRANGAPCVERASAGRSLRAPGLGSRAGQRSDAMIDDVVW